MSTTFDDYDGFARDSESYHEAVEFAVMCYREGYLKLDTDTVDQPEDWHDVIGAPDVFDSGDADNHGVSDERFREDVRQTLRVASPDDEVPDQFDAEGDSGVDPHGIDWASLWREWDRDNNEPVSKAVLRLMVEISEQTPEELDPDAVINDALGADLLESLGPQDGKLVYTAEVNPDV